MKRNRMSKYVEEALGKKFCFTEAGVLVFGPGGDGRLPPEQNFRGFRTQPYAITADVSVTHTTHASRTGVFTVATGATVTLPRTSGQGGKFRFVCGILIAGGNAKIQVGNTDDVMQGPVFGLQDGGDTVEGWESAAGSDTFNMNGSTQGGLKGDWVEFEDVAVGLWQVHAGITQTGTQATPYSSAV